MIEEQIIPGLTKPESKLYFTLLKLKTATAREIAQATGFHRTNIYDVMEKLKEKGLVTFYKEGNANYFKAADPHNLHNYLDNQHDTINVLLPELSHLYHQKKEEIDIERFQGKQGIIAAYKDILREKKPVFAFGISAKLKEKIPIFREQFIQSVVKQKIPYQLIYTRRITTLPKAMQQRFLQQEFISPIEVHLYGGKTLQIIWEPDMRAILIKSKQFTETYKKHFKLLWKQAEV